MNWHSYSFLSIAIVQVTEDKELDQDNGGGHRKKRDNYRDI